MSYLRKSLALIDEECKSLEEALLDPAITDKDMVLRAIDGNAGDWLTKIDNISRMLDWWRTEREYLKQHIAYLRENSKAMEERDQIIRQAVVESMVLRNEKKLKFGSTGITMWWQDLEPEITVEDERQIPDEFMKVVPAHFEPDVAKYKEHFKKTGELVKGFKVVGNRKSLVVRG